MSNIPLDNQDLFCHTESRMKKEKHCYQWNPAQLKVYGENHSNGCSRPSSSCGPRLSSIAEKEGDFFSASSSNTCKIRFACSSIIFPKASHSSGCTNLSKMTDSN